MLFYCQTARQVGNLAQNQILEDTVHTLVPKYQNWKIQKIQNKELSDWPSWDLAAIADASVAYSGAKVDRYRKWTDMSPNIQEY